MYFCCKIGCKYIGKYAQFVFLEDLFFYSFLFNLILNRLILSEEKQRKHSEKENLKEQIFQKLIEN